MSETGVRTQEPGYMCCYQDEEAGLELCVLLGRYGIEARVLPPVDPHRANSCFRVYVSNAAEVDRAIGFKRGLQAALGMRGDVGAFAEGLMAGALMRGRRDREKISGSAEDAPLGDQLRLTQAME